LLSLTSFCKIKGKWNANQCHFIQRLILSSAHSEELERILAQKQNEAEESKNRLELEEGGPTVSAFINWLYTKNNGKYEFSFRVAFGLLKLGHLYNVPDLIGVAAQILIRKIEVSQYYELNRVTPTELWKLYNFVRLVDKIEIMVKLKKTILISIRR